MNLLLSEIEQSFKNSLASIGHPFVGEMKFDCDWQRYPCPDSKESKTSARYRAHSDWKPKPILKFQCKRCDINQNFPYKGLLQKNLISHQYAEIQAQAAKRKAEQAKRSEAARTNALIEIESIWKSAIPCLSHKYFERKCLSVTEKDGLRLNSNGRILCPVRLISGDLVSLQTIPVQGLKLFHKDTSPKNGFHAFGELEAYNEVFFAEGVATSLTIRACLNKPVICVYGKHFSDVAPIIAKAYPNKQFIYCCDLSSQGENVTSKDNAAKASALVSGSLVLPEFSEIPEDLKPEIARSDFNDLFVLLMAKGLDRATALAQVRQQIQSSAKGNSMTDLENVKDPLPHSQVLNKLLEKIVPIDFRSKASLEADKQLLNSHYQIIVIENILDLAKESNWGLCRNHDFIYLFNGCFWSLINEDELKMFLGHAAERMQVDKFKARHFNFREQLYKQFIALANLPKLDHVQDKVFINLKNGTFEITPKETNLRVFNHADFLTYQLPFEYDTNAKAPHFEKYLNRVLPDQKKQLILAEYLGYVFIRTSFLKLEKTLLLYGSGANGKSVFYEVVRHLLGEQNTCEYSLQSLTNENGYFRAMIANKLVNYASEINGKLQAAVFKQLVSGEPVEARLPYGNPFTITQYAKLIFNCNELPKDVEQTEAYFRRFLIIPFDVTIPEAEQDKQLAHKIISNELSGIFNWVLSGLSRLLENKNFTDCDAVQKARAQYELESDSVKQFINESGYKSHPSNFVLLKHLYQEYRAFCNDDGFKPVSKTNFNRRLTLAKITLERRNCGNVVFIAKQLQ